MKPARSWEHQRYSHKRGELVQLHSEFDEDAVTVADILPLRGFRKVPAGTLCIYVGPHRGSTRVDSSVDVLIGDHLGWVWRSEIVRVKGQ